MVYYNYYSEKINMDYGKRFKLYRENAGLTQRQAAELIGVNPYQLANYETGRSEPSLDILKKMSKVYEVSIDNLLGNRGSKANNNAELRRLINELAQLYDGDGDD